MAAICLQGQIRSDRSVQIRQSSDLQVAEPHREVRATKCRSQDSNSTQSPHLDPCIIPRLKVDLTGPSVCRPTPSSAPPPSRASAGPPSWHLPVNASSSPFLLLPSLPSTEPGPPAPSRCLNKSESCPVTPETIPAWLSGLRPSWIQLAACK